MRLWHRCFPVNFVEFLRAPFLQNTSGQLLFKTNDPFHWSRNPDSQIVQTTYPCHLTFTKVRENQSYHCPKVIWMKDIVRHWTIEKVTKYIILYVVTNVSNSEKIVSQTANLIKDPANSLKNEPNTIHLPLIVPRNDNLNNKMKEVSRC